MAPLYTRRYIIIIYCITLFLPLLTVAQVPLTSVNINYVTVSGGNYSKVITSHSASNQAVKPNTNYGVSYNNTSNVSIESYIAAGKTYVRYANFDTVFIKRVANALETTGGNKQQIYCEGPAVVDSVNHAFPLMAAYPQSANQLYMEKVIKDGYINRGCDNIFSNTGDVTINNIERVDIVLKRGFANSDPAAAGFAITDRGGNDAFKIAAITAIDAVGNPTAYGPVLLVAATNYGTDIWSGTTYVMRKDPADSLLRPFKDIAPQAVKGIFIRYSDLSIAADQRIYGYSLMAPDVTAITSAQILDYTNALLYPTNTPNAIGGLDLATAPGIFVSTLVLPVKLLSFDTRLNNSDVHATWETTDELKVDHYELQRSYDGNSFSTIANVQPQTNLTAKSVYNYTDKHADLTYKTIYYRLRFADKNNKYSYSLVNTVKIGGTETTIKIYPNPVAERLLIEIPAAWQGKAISYEIFNSTGTKIKSLSRAYGNATENFNLTELLNGVYVVKISSGLQTINKIITKNN